MDIPAAVNNITWSDDMQKTNLSPPWISFYSMLEAMFKDDPDIRIVYEKDDLEIKLYVDNHIKAEALGKLLPTEKVFGNVTVCITVIPGNKEPTKAELIRKAFYHNPVLKEIVTADTPMGRMDFVMFKNEVVQFYDDNMSDPEGLRSTLYQEIAKEVFGNQLGLFYCTEKGEK